MKIKTYLIAIAIISFTSGITSCKKDNNNSGSSTDTATEAKAQADDQNFYTTETDAVTDDVNASLNTSGGSYNETPAGVQTPVLALSCDATITVDTSANPRTITITYNGSSCDGRRTRAGTVIVSFATDFKWGMKGAQLSVQFVNLKITRNLDGKSIVVNGTRTITNVSGGLLKNLATLDSVVHQIDDTNMSITFDNGKQRTWETHMTRTFTYDNGIVISTAGTVGGENRFGDDFSTSTEAPLVVKQSCDFRLVSGEVKHVGPKVTTDATFGLDIDGNPVTSCPLVFYMKVVWTGSNGNSLSAILPY
ncbi:MAG TPA: hypothetical protein VG847_11515 [Chitinophagaceae bacterium]|nr:hypothetical protein [Chitinophagaceae bacterium]